MKIKANGISMNYELSGSGRCFTLIHGAGDNLNAWYNQVPVFSQHYRVLTYDVRGHGQTELPEVELSAELWVEDLRALLEALNISEIILLGYSMGGAIALEFALTHSKMVTALILSNTGVQATVVAYLKLPIPAAPIASESGHSQTGAGAGAGVGVGVGAGAGAGAAQAAKMNATANMKDKQMNINLCFTDYLLFIML